MSDQCRPRDSYLENTEHTQEDILVHALNGILTRDTNNRTAAVPRFRPHGHRDRLLFKITLGSIRKHIKCQERMTNR